MIPDTASPIEVVFFMIGLFCLAISGWGVALAGRDVRYVHARRRGSPDYAILILLAKQQRRNEGIRLGKQVGWVGVYGFWLAAPSPIRETLQLLLVVTSTAVAINQILLAYATVMDRLDNLKAQRLARRRPTVDLRLVNGGNPDGTKRKNPGPQTPDQ